MLGLLEKAQERLLMVAFQKIRLKPGQLVTHQEINHLTGLEAPVDIISEHHKMRRCIAFLCVGIYPFEKHIEEISPPVHISHGVDHKPVRKCRRACLGFAVWNRRHN